MEFPRPPFPSRLHANTSAPKLSTIKESNGKETASPEVIRADGNSLSIDEGTRATRTFQSSRHDSTIVAYDQSPARGLAARSGINHYFGEKPKSSSRAATDEAWPGSRYPEFASKPASVETWDDFELEEATLSRLQIDDPHPRAAESSMSPSNLKRRPTTPPPRAYFSVLPYYYSGPSRRREVLTESSSTTDLSFRRIRLIPTTKDDSLDSLSTEGRAFANYIPDVQSSMDRSVEVKCVYMCECCPKKPKKFESSEELSAHEQEKQYRCVYCSNRFKNKNEAERHQNSLHLRHFSWSCARLSGYPAAFHPSSTRPNEVDTCGYCGEDFPRSGISSPSSGSQIATTEQDWDLRIAHLQDIHKFGECNHAKKFFREDHFRQHLKYSHAGTSGTWSYVLVNACMQKESPEPQPMPTRGPSIVFPDSFPEPLHEGIFEPPIIASPKSFRDLGLQKILESDEIVLEPPSNTLETVDDTDIKTTFSKDSGYSSMASRAPKQILEAGEIVRDSDKWESESVDSVQTFATKETKSSINPAAAGGAAEELAELFVKDDLICGLITDGYKNHGSVRFERNLRRILKKFASSLRKEAQSDIEKSVIRLVHNYRAYVIILIRQRLELGDEGQHPASLEKLRKQKQSKITLERFLGSLPGTEKVGVDDQAEVNESGSDDDSDLSNDEQPYLPTLEKVKLYLLSSTAYFELKEQLMEFVRAVRLSNPTRTLDPERAPQVEMETTCDGESISTTEEYILPSQRLAPKELESDFPKFGSTSFQGVEFTWNAVSDMHQQKEFQSLSQDYPTSMIESALEDKATEKSPESASQEDYCLKSVGPKQVPSLVSEKEALEHCEYKHGKIEEALLSLKLWMTGTPLYTFLPCLPLALQNLWARSRRKLVSIGHTRIKWKCACGHDLYADFASREIANRYAAIIQSTTNGNMENTISQSSVNPLTLPPSAYFPQPGISVARGLRDSANNDLTPNCTSQASSGTANQNLDLSFLELCVNTGPHLKSLAEIDVANISCDGALFCALRKQYLRLRGFRSRFWLLKPTSVSFVRFSLENRHRVGILQKPLALPPKSEVNAKKWIYDPCPLDGDPPISQDLFLHYLQCSEGPGSLFWMLRFPRKLETSMLKSAAPASFGWGIHIDEGPDLAALFKANFIVVLLSGVSAGLWTLFKHDFQGAFGFACWIIAVLNSLLMAYMFKWKQE